MLIILSDFFINIAAGWFGAIFIEPKLFEQTKKIQFASIVFNFSFMMLSIFISYKLKFNK